MGATIRFDGGLFKCGNCGATLTFKTGDTTSRCEFCGTENMVPEALWKVLSPTAEPMARPPELRRQPALPAQPPAGLYVPPPRARPSTAKAAAVAAGCVLFFAGLSTTIMLVKNRPGTGGVLGDGHGRYGDAVSMIDAAMVVPSFESADPSKTARNFYDAVRAKWKADAVVASIYYTKVRSDGTLDLAREDEGMISISFMDSAAMAKAIPGETSIKGAALHLSVQENNMYASVGDGDVSSFRDGRYIDFFPSCSAAGLWAAAKQEGWPDGFASISIPSMITSAEPTELINIKPKRDVISGTLPTEVPAGRLIKVPMAVFSLPSFDTGSRTTLYNVNTCEPRK